MKSGFERMFLMRHVLKSGSLVNLINPKQLQNTSFRSPFLIYSNQSSLFKAAIITRHFGVGPPNKSLSHVEKLKNGVKDYGYTVAVFHISLSLTSLAGFYLAVSSGLDVVGLLKKYDINIGDKMTSVASGTSTMVIAYAIHKVFAPVRVAITMGCVPFLVRYLRKIGVLRLPKSSK